MDFLYSKMIYDGKYDGRVGEKIRGLTEVAAK